MGAAGLVTEVGLKYIDSPAVQDEIFVRIGTLTPDDQARWGKMTVQQMICHLGDGYRAVMARRKLDRVEMGIPRPLLKWIALRVPLRWPKDVPAPHEITQGMGGTPPGAFESDREELVRSLREFCEREPPEDCAHPLFGRMNGRDWMRWAYLHADHHLRQFGR